MAKPRKVIAVGNSFAIVLDKRTCRMLRIDRTTELNVSLENRDTILIRPIRRADRTGQPDRFVLSRTMRALIQQHGLSDAEFKPLSHDKTSFRTFLLDVDVGGKVDLTTVDRLAYCLLLRSDARRLGVDTPWDETIRSVLERFPDRPVPQPNPTDDPENEGTLAARTLAAPVPSSSP